MDIKTIKALTKLMNDNGLVELEVEAEDLKVKLSKSAGAAGVAPVAPIALPAAAPAPVQAAAPAADTPAASSEADLSHCKEITSPIPGTVYLKPNPESDTYVGLGSSVKEGDITCLVEAMKVFNEIKAEGIAGTIKKICVEDGQAVEYGTVLFLVE